AVGLAVCGLGIGLVPGIRAGVEQAAARFVDRTGYAATVLRGSEPHSSAVSGVSPTLLDVALGLGTTPAAVALAWLSLAPPRPALHRVGRATGSSIRALG